MYSISEIPISDATGTSAETDACSLRVPSMRALNRVLSRVCGRLTGLPWSMCVGNWAGACRPHRLRHRHCWHPPVSHRTLTWFETATHYTTTQCTELELKSDVTVKSLPQISPPNHDFIRIATPAVITGVAFLLDRWKALRSTFDK